MSRAYEYRHVVGFEETNVVGNVYYANHVRWQGRCRELFLRDHASEIVKELERDLVLVTIRVSCEYFNELYAFDEVIVRMRAGPITQAISGKEFTSLTRLNQFVRYAMRTEPTIRYAQRT